MADTQLDRETWGSRRRVRSPEMEQAIFGGDVPFFPVPRPNLILATMWAISDFTADNGGTQLVPGSHLWSADRVAEPSEIVRAEMPAGSLGWLRQEENQHLSMPAGDAFALSDAVRSRLGFAMDNGDGGLGFYDPPVLAAVPSQVPG